MATANEFATSNLISKSTTEFWEQKSPIYNTSNHDYLEMFEQKDYATNGSINIKVPGYPISQRGLVNTPTAIQDLIIPYTITENDIFNVTRELNVYELLFKVLNGDMALTRPVKEAIVDNYAYPAFERLEADVEAELALKLKTNTLYSPIDTIDKLGGVNVYSSISQIDTMMNLLKLSSDRYAMLNEEDAQKVTDSQQNAFNPMRNEKITRTARIGGKENSNFAGFDMWRSPDLPNHEAGPLKDVSGITVQSVSSDGLQITFTGVPSTTGKLINAGDRVSIPAVFWVNRINKTAINYRLTLAAISDANGNGSGQVTMTIAFPLIASGEHANVDSLPASSDEAYFFPDYKPNYAYTMAGISTVPLRLGNIFGAVNSTVTADNKIPVKITLQGAALEFSNIFRTSQLIGTKVVSPYVVAIPSAV